MTQIKEKMIRIGKMARQASEDMRQLSSEDRSRILMNISQFIKANHFNILEANQTDIEDAKNKNLPSPLVNRLILDQKKNRCSGKHCRKYCSNARSIRSNFR